MTRKHPNPKRQFRGGPEVYTPGIKHGFRQSERLPHGPVLSIVKDGQVLMPKRFKRALGSLKNSELQLSPQPIASAGVSAIESFPAAGMPLRKTMREHVDPSPARTVNQAGQFDQKNTAGLGVTDEPEGRTNVKGESGHRTALSPTGQLAQDQRQTA